MQLQNTVVTDILGVGTVYSPKGRKVEMKNRPCYGLSFCIDGQITYSQNGKEYVSDPDHAIILPMGQCYVLKGDKTGSFPVINFSTLAPLCDTITVLELCNRELLLRKYEEMKKLFVDRNNRAKIFSIFYEMLYELSTQNESSELRAAIKYIYNNYHLPSITNERLAKECKISEVYFRKLFKKAFEMSPKQFIIELRMQKAKQLLSEGTQKIWAISEACGFSSAYHFCRLFKQHTGLTPHDYRKQNQILEF